MTEINNTQNIKTLIVNASNIDYYTNLALKNKTTLDIGFVEYFTLDELNEALKTNNTVEVSIFYRDSLPESVYVDKNVNRFRRYCIEYNRIWTISYIRDNLFYQIQEDLINNTLADKVVFTGNFS